MSKKNHVERREHQQRKKADWYRSQSLAYAQIAKPAKKVKPPKVGPRLFDAFDAYDKTSAAWFLGKKKKKPLFSKFRAKYINHLQSDKWRRFVKKINKERGSLCEDCGSKHELHVHHLHYRTLGHEKPEDVRLVCKPCHERIHGRKF